jgi:hypothetical protein
VISVCDHTQGRSLAIDVDEAANVKFPHDARASFKDVDR